MKKKILAALCAIFAIAGARAEYYDYHFVVLNLTDSQTVEFAFADEPVATFDGSDLVITTDGGINKVAYGTEEIARITFREMPSGVEKTEAVSLRISVRGDVLHISGLAEGAGVKVYALDGRLVVSAAAGADQTAVADLSGLPSGVYAVKAGNESFKFIK